MENIIELSNVNYQIKNTILFKNLNWIIKKGSFVTLLGKSGVGKTTLLKLMTGEIKSDNKIKINGLYVKEENLFSIRSKIGFVYENPEQNLIADNVKDDILYSIPKGKYTYKKMEEMFQEIIKFLEIDHLLDKSTSQLSGGEKQLVAIAGILLRGAKLLLLDNSFSMLDTVTKNKILKKLKFLNRNQKLTIIYVTNDIEDSLYGNYIALLGEQKMSFFGKNNQAFKEEELFLKEGFELPFMIQLSTKLKYYNVVTKQIIDINKMVDEIWK